jgi:hypothetical protein
MAYHHNLSSQDLPLHHFTDQQATENHTAPPNWLNTALLRSQQPPQQQTHHHFTDNNNTNNFLNLHTAATTATATTSDSNSHNPVQWLSRSSSSLLNRNHSDVIDDVAAGGDHAIITSISQESSELKNMNKSEGEAMDSGGGESVVNWQNARYKADILTHPLYDQLLSAHVACLRIATPVDQLPRIDAQLAQSQQVVTKYSALGSHQGLVPDDKELDQFMVCYHVS